MSKTKHKNQRNTLQSNQLDKPAPILEHLLELRRRVFYCLLSVGVIGTAAYFVQQRLVTVLLSPTHGQQFIYTGVGGGINFLFRLCLSFGVALSLPVIAYQILRYLQPIMKFESRRFVAIASISCGLLALAGMAFGYYVGLPAALHFLLHQFTTKQIRPLLTIQEYMSFITAYMVGSAMLFQVPLLLLFINRIKPLKPRRLWHYERWVILGAFIVSVLMNPTPQIMSQLALAGPIIIMYQIAIVIIWQVNKKPKLSLDAKQLLQTMNHQEPTSYQTRPKVSRQSGVPRLTSAFADSMIAPKVQSPVVPQTQQTYKPQRPTYIMDIRPQMRRAAQ